jgi:predicted homoserine dehydrogenase-like protein
VVTDGIVEVSLSETEMEVLRETPPRDVGPLMEERRKALKDLGHLQEADLCESVIAANATGLMADVPSLHGPIVRITEIPQVLCPTEAGGILRKRGAIDVVICLRRLDEAGLAGGVFIVFAGKNDYTWSFLKAKGIVASRIGPYGLIYRPYHLLGAETPISILCAGLLNVSTGGLTVEPRVDLVARATRDLKAGSILDLAHEHSDACVEPLIIPTTEVSEASLLPLYLAVGNRLRVGVTAGTMLTSQMVEAPAASRLWALRREQDRVFREVL